MELRLKAWLEVAGRPAFGEGLLQMLNDVAELGSLSAAAARMSMSYREAWGRVRDAEERLGRPLLVRQTGGRGGGGARLTAFAAELLRRFELIEAALHEYAAGLADEHLAPLEAQLRRPDCGQI
jgi:molybdate transport system regulatory protein